MRLQRLRLAPWGCFADQEVDFAAKGTVDLVVGPNAAGKSTLARGTLGLVFGIDQRTVDAHTFPYPDLRIGGRLELGEETIDVVRRKGRVGTLATPEGEALPDDLFAARLGGLSKEVFQSLLMIDNPSLKQGAAELLQGRGEVGASLFAAAAGIATLHQTVDRFDVEAKRAFNPGGRTDPVHNALRDLRDAEKRQREGTLRPRKHREMERELERLETECEELRIAMADLEAQAQALRRKRAVAPLLARHRELTEALEKLGDAPDLPEDARPRRTAAETAKRSAERRLARAREKADQLETRLEGLDVDEALLRRADEVRVAHQAVPVIAKAAADRPRRQRALTEAEERLRAAATTAGVEPDEVEQLRRPEAARRRLDDAIRIREQLVERRRAADEACSDARQRVAQAEERLADSPEPVDITALAAATRAALAAGSIEAQEREAKAEVERLAAEAQARLKRLSPGPASLEELQNTAVPTAEAVAAAGSAADEARQTERDLQGENERLAREREELQEQSDQLALGATVPTAVDLSESRSNRDQSWAQLRPALESGVAVEPGLVGEYEMRVGEADSVADAQVVGAAQLAGAARIEAAERKLARRAELLGKREAEFSSHRQQLAATWVELWAGTSFEAPELSSGSSWLERRDRILALCSDAARQQVKARALAEGIKAHTETLTSRLAAHGVNVAPSSSLVELAQLAEHVLEGAAASERAHEELDRTLAEARSALASAEREADSAREAWAEWESGWPQVLAATGLPAETTPKSALEVSRAVADGLEELARISELKRSVVGIDCDRSQFEAQVEKLCSAVAPDLKPLEPDAAVATLIQRLAEAEAEAATRTALLEQQVELGTELQEAEDELAEADDVLEELRLAAGCEAVAELQALEGKSSRARELRQELAQLEQQAVEVGEDRFDRLVGDLSQFEPDTASARLRQIEEEVDELGSQRDGIKTTLGERQAELRAAESDVSPVAAAEDAELAKAELELAARDHVRAKLAAIVVRRAMERYRRLHENPLLARANALFARFTLGSFVELFVDHDPGAGAILVGRQRDRQLKRVEEMSSGTREQLFLALRIAAIERYVTTVGAVPVIFDDAFLESDEKRSAKIFEALAELAVITQVIVLTHRERLAELGRQVLGERLAVVELPDAAPVLRAAGDAALAAA